METPRLRFNPHKDAFIPVLCLTQLQRLRDGYRVATSPYLVGHITVILAVTQVTLFSLSCLTDVGWKRLYGLLRVSSGVRIHSQAPGFREGERQRVLCAPGEQRSDEHTADVERLSIYIHLGEPLQTAYYFPVNSELLSR